MSSDGSYVVVNRYAIEAKMKWVLKKCQRTVKDKPKGKENAPSRGTVEILQVAHREAASETIHSSR